GLLWLEPLVERVDDDGARIGWSNVTPDEVTGEGVLSTFVGRVEDIDFLARQDRWIFERMGITDPVDPEDYLAHGGMVGLRAALAMSASDVVDSVIDSGLRGRGGAGFPAGIKWRTVAETPASPHRGEPATAPAHKYICVNADEGDSGTYADRMVMEGDPFLLLEGMAIAAHAVGADRGIVYVRSEYPDAISVMTQAVDIARANGWLGEGILGSIVSFDVEIRVGAGSYVCGEETAMLESIEGRRGMVRTKPPLPAIEGLFGTPTVINNVLTVASVPLILARGSSAYAALGTDASHGTQVFQLSGNVARGGIVESAFGISAHELVYDFGGGTLSGRPVRAVQIGGPLGAYLPSDRLDVPMGYETLAESGGMLGHGGLVVFDETVDMAAQARFAMEFCAEESCGKCTPCRIGSVRGVEVIDRIRGGEDAAFHEDVLRDLCEVMTDGSLCAMGGLTPMPVLSALDNFPEDFQHAAGGE
ncbi:MAG: NADH-ubiquinone oxidoreductase-F iron-sulfur binding region domain-containing protein, partial [Actinomycetota bacterium]|nr:NADH-ubiquinone oxidoreductase-F iron-sulfur binding region domain-containing protein [Actinomycetota bacterium]